MIELLLVAMLLGGQAKPGHVSKDPIMVSRSPAESLRDWAVARCIARGAPGVFARDAAVSAAALLEQGDYGITTYEAVEALVGRQLARRYGGSVAGDYVTLKCLDLAHDAELGRLIAGRTPPRAR